MSNKENENKELLRQAAKAFNNIKDRSGWFDFHSESVVVHGLSPETLDLDGTKNFYGCLWHGFPDLTIKIDDLVGEGDQVVWRISATGTHTGLFQGLEPSGKKVSFGAQYTFRFKNGKIVERWSNIDRLTALIQVGAVSLPFKK